YEDGDLSVRLFSSTDGETWTMGPEIYGVAADTPLETEIVFMPSGRMLALVRVDGTDDELLGNRGRLRTIACWASAPYDTFRCPQGARRGCFRRAVRVLPRRPPLRDRAKALPRGA